MSMDNAACENKLASGMSEYKESAYNRVAIFSEGKES